MPCLFVVAVYFHACSLKCEHCYWVWNVKPSHILGWHNQFEQPVFLHTISSHTIPPKFWKLFSIHVKKALVNLRVVPVIKKKITQPVLEAEHGLLYWLASALNRLPPCSQSDVGTSTAMSVSVFVANRSSTSCLKSERLKVTRNPFSESRNKMKNSRSSSVKLKER